MKYILWFSWWIDSTYTAWKLNKSGHEVLLVHIKNTIDTNKCCSLPNELTAIAKKLWLKLEIIPAINEFKELVIDEFANNYKKWITPNPCINCNEMVRFKILEKIRQKYWYDKITTWHYADITNIKWNNFLKIPKDKKKDQTYMLYRISNVKLDWIKLLNSIEFILNNTTKTELKKEAIKYDIPSKNTKESQNICFIPDDDYPRFIKQNYPDKFNNTNKAWFLFNKWAIKDKDWNYIWEHNWLLNYTIWQRHWLKLNINQKVYITKINPTKNEIIVWEEEDLYQKKVEIMNHFIHKEIISDSQLHWKIRYHHPIQEIEQIVDKGNILNIFFKEHVRAPTPWQHLVIYTNDVLIWGWQIISTD